MVIFVCLFCSYSPPPPPPSPPPFFFFFFFFFSYFDFSAITSLLVRRRWFVTGLFFFDNLTARQLIQGTKSLSRLLYLKMEEWHVFHLLVYLRFLHLAIVECNKYLILSEEGGKGFLALAVQQYEKHLPPIKMDHLQ